MAVNPYSLLLLLAILLYAPLQQAKADIITPGSTTKKFRITNLEDYPEYEFFIGYQSGNPFSGLSMDKARKGEWVNVGSSKNAKLAALRTSDSTWVWANTMLEGGDISYADVDGNILEEITLLDVTPSRIDFETSAKLSFGDAVLFYGGLILVATALGFLVRRRNKRKQSNPAV